jgi:diguanylate cyclase
MLRQVWVRYLAAVHVVGAICLLAPASVVTELLLARGIGLSAVVAVVVGVSRNRPALRLPWLLFAIGIGSFLTADVCAYLMEEVLGLDLPFPSFADGFSLAMYPLLMAGMVLLTRQLLGARDWASVLDAAIISTGMLVLSWVLVMDTYAIDAGAATTARVIALAFPIRDMALFAVGVHLAMAVRTRVPAFFLICGSILGLLAANTLQGLGQLDGTHPGGGVGQLGLMAFYGLFGAAALHPSMVTLSEAAEGRWHRLGRHRIVILSLATLAVPVTDLLVQDKERIDEVVLLVGSMVLFLLVLARVMGLVRSVEEGQRQLRHEALHDGLTGLANRTLFTDRLEAVLADEQGRDRLVTVMFVDLDDFKTVNDTLGHQAGDELLNIVALRLGRSVRGGDTVARLGGDEFAVLLPGASTAEEARLAAERLLGTLREPLMLHGRELMVSASVGIAVQPTSTTHVDKLLRGADVAMYLAKSKGKGRCEVFEQSMYDEVIDRLELKNDLQSALGSEELAIFYQPIVDFDGTIRSLEALLRWQHPTRGMVSPDRFVPLAEETGLIVPIGRWVLLDACTTVRRWQLEDPRHEHMGVSVNLSVRQLHDPTLVDDVAEALRVSGLPAESLTLEITESILMQDVELAVSRLMRLKQLDVKVAIDDFGTGYSSLSYLQRFPVDIIKIDRSFIEEINDGSNNNAALVRSVIELAGALSMSTVAEGIEDQDQLRMLHGLRCDRAQGFLFSRPLPAADMETMLTLGPLGRPTPDGAELAVVVRHDDVLDRLGPELDALHLATGTPLTGRRPWLQAWQQAHRDQSPVSLTVVETATGQLTAAAFLAVSGADGITCVVAQGGTAGGGTHFSVRPGAEQALATGLAQLLTEQGGPWWMHLEQLPAGDPTVEAIVRQLDHVVLLDERRAPHTTLSREEAAAVLASRSTRKTLRLARNRVAREGGHLDLSALRHGSQLIDVIDDLERIRRQRDHDRQRRSDLDDRPQRSFWRRSILEHGARGEAEVLTLRVDGALAAYAVALLDGTSYRIFEGRFDSRFARFAPGRLVGAFALERALGNERFEQVDCTTTVAAAPVEGAVAGRVRLLAASSAEVLEEARSGGVLRFPEELEMVRAPQ